MHACDISQGCAVIQHFWYLYADYTRSCTSGPIMLGITLQLITTAMHIHNCHVLESYQDLTDVNWQIECLIARHGQQSGVQAHSNTQYIVRALIMRLAARARARELTESATDLHVQLCTVCVVRLNLIIKLSITIKTSYLSFRATSPVTLLSTTLRLRYVFIALL